MDERRTSMDMKNEEDPELIDLQWELTMGKDFKPFWTRAFKRWCLAQGPLSDERRGVSDGL